MVLRCTVVDSKSAEVKSDQPKVRAVAPVLQGMLSNCDLGPSVNIYFHCCANGGLTDLILLFPLMRVFRALLPDYFSSHNAICSRPWSRSEPQAHQHKMNDIHVLDTEISPGVDQGTHSGRRIHHACHQYVSGVHLGRVERIGKPEIKNGIGIGMWLAVGQETVDD